MNKIHYGFIPEPQITPDQYVLGGELVPTNALVPSGQWDLWLPDGERQNISDIETCNCTSFGSCNMIEILLNRLYGITGSWSDRYVGIVNGTRPPGASPHTVLETIRKTSGLIPEELLPFDPKISTVSEYYSPTPMRQDLLNRGQEWLKSFILKHEWVYMQSAGLKQKQKALMQALKYSPVGISVYAWELSSDGLYIKPQGLQDTHWTVCYGYEEGKHWKILDSYEPYLKKVAWDTDFMQAKRIHIEKNTAQPIPPSVLERFKKILDFIQAQINELVKKKPNMPTEQTKPSQTENGKKLYATAKSCIGLQVIKLTALTQFGVLGCMASLNAVFKKAFGKEIGGGASTQNALPFLEDTSRFMEVAPEDSLAGDIWMYATGTSTKFPQSHGHVFVKGNQWMMSNSSETGRWEANYTVEGARKYYEDTMGFAPRIFRVI